jgi:hypothetical protein
VPALHLDHKDLRAIFDKDPVFLAEVKEAVLKTAIKGHAIRYLSEAEKFVAGDIFKAEMKGCGLISPTYGGTNYKLSPETTKKISDTCSSKVDEIVNKELSRLLEETSTTLTQKINDYIRSVTEYMNGEIERVLQERLEKRVDTFITDRIALILSGNKN